MDGGCGNDAVTNDEYGIAEPVSRPVDGEEFGYPLCGFAAYTQRRRVLMDKL